MFEKIKIFLKENLSPILWIIAFAYTLPAYNKFWAPFDEGIIVVAGQRVLAGEIPYKDFFILMYPPAQIYIVALLLKIFSASLIAGRIYTVLISAGSTMLVFYFTRMLTKNNLFAVFSWLVALTSLAPRLGTIPAPIWPGVFAGLLAIYTYARYMEKGRDSLLIYAGIFTGVSMLFRHDIGIFAGLAIFIPLFIQTVKDKNLFHRIRTFFAGIVIVILPCLVYFINKSALRDMFRSLILFTFIHERAAGLPFPKPCFDLNMIFHGSLHFIKVNQYYIPLIVYAIVFLYLINKYFIKKFYETQNLILTSVLLFGILTFNQVRIRTDPAHLLTVIEPALILSGFALYKVFSSSPFRVRLLKVPVGAVLLALLILLSVKNADKYMKNTFTKVYKRKIVKAHFDGGAIYVPIEEREDVLNTISFIKKNTSPKERIYVGNTAHWKDDFGGTLILYFLAGRLPSTKYYELAPQLVTDPNVQQEIKNSLLIHEVKLLVLQDIDLTDLNKEDIPEDRLILDSFIQRTYKPVKKFGKYNIFMKKGL